MRIVLLGAPGSGKGTQAQKLQAKYGVPQISSGDLLRDAVARGTELGKKAKAVMDAGQLVSDDIVLGLIRDRLSRTDAASGFILDGFPRNIDQANALNTLLDTLDQPIDAVLLLEVRHETLISRLAGRRVCPKCGTVYNVHSMAPGATGCAKDGAELVQRPDDNEAVIAKRLEVYDQQTRPLVEHYSKLGLLRVVAGEGEFDEVFERMESAALAKSLPPGKVSVKRTSERPPAVENRGRGKSTAPNTSKKNSPAKKSAKNADSRRAAARVKSAGTKSSRTKASRAQTSRAQTSKAKTSRAKTSRVKASKFQSSKKRGTTQRSKLAQRGSGTKKRKTIKQPKRGRAASKKASVRRATNSRTASTQRTKVSSRKAAKRGAKARGKK